MSTGLSMTSSLQAELNTRTAHKPPKGGSLKNFRTDERDTSIFDPYCVAGSTLSEASISVGEGREVL